MCGNVGLAGKLAFKDEGLMKALLFNDYVRGKDSTGLASISKSSNEVKIAKVPSHPFDLFDMSSFRSALNGHGSKVLLGHNRAATRGSVEKRNAHPFHHGNIVGSHNGSLDFTEWRELEDAVGEKFGTDSEAIIAGIDRLGIKDTFGMLRGAWSVVWVNTEENTLNFLRNDQRPMYIAHSKDFEKIYWSSAWEILSAAVLVTDQYSTLDFAHQTKDKYTYVPTEVDTHYRYDLAAFDGAKSIVKPSVKKVYGKKEAPKGYQNPFTKKEEVVLGLPPAINSGGSNTKNTSGNQNRSSTGSDKIHGEVISLFDRQPFAQLVSKDKFDELNRHGCAWCGGNDYNWEDEGWILIQSQDAIICPDCTHERHGNRVYTEHAHA